MKIESISNITNQKTNIFGKIRRFFVGKLKPLVKDTFEKSSTTPKREKIVSRKYPNWCEGPDSTYRNNTIAERICYYPEDIEKMKSMTEDEAILFKRQLYKNSKFYYDDGSNDSLKELEEFLHSCGATLDDIRMKD